MRRLGKRQMLGLGAAFALHRAQWEWRWLPFVQLAAWRLEHTASIRAEYIERQRRIASLRTKVEEWRAAAVRVRQEAERLEKQADLYELDANRLAKIVVTKIPHSPLSDDGRRLDEMEMYA